MPASIGYIRQPKVELHTTIKKIKPAETAKTAGSRQIPIATPPIIS